MTVIDDLESKVTGFWACLGGEEIKRASATLAGPVQQVDNQTASGGTPYGLSPNSPVCLSLQDETDPHVKDLLFAAKRYASLMQADPNNFDSVYNHGLVLQELAAKLRWGIEGGEREGQMKHVWQLLREACDRYGQALEIRPKFHAALYNWGVALSELAGLLKGVDGRTALHCLHEASSRYAESLLSNPNNPQALNNWGLVLQEVSTYHTDLEAKLMLAAQAIDKFRRSIRLRPDFDHGCYNLGTVFYTHATTIRNQLRRSQAANVNPGIPEGSPALHALVGSEIGTPEAVDSLMGKAAQFISMAWALQPNKEVYIQSVRVVQAMLPKPFLRVGYLKAPRLNTLGGPTESWERQWFALDQEALRSGGALQLMLRSRGQKQISQDGATSSDDYIVYLSDIVSAVRCLELSLPEGEAFWIGLRSRPQGMYFVAEDKESAEEWVDVLTIMQYIHSQQRTKTLSEVLSSEKTSKSSD